MAIDKTTHSFGTILKTGTWSAATPETIPTMTAFGQATNITVPSLKTTAISATRLNQTDRYKRFRAGLVEAGEMKFDGFFDKTDYNTLLGYVTSGTEVWWQVAIPEPDNSSNLSTFTFHGFVLELGQSEDEDSSIMCPVTVKVNGKPQFTAYS